MAKAAADNNDPSKMFSADVVAAVLAASGVTSLSMKQYEMMSAIDGNRTASGFQHAFRSIIAKSKEFKKRVEDGEEFVPVAPGYKRGPTGASASPATPRKRKAAGADADATPTKKRTPSKKKKTSESPTNELDGGDDDLPADMDEFIKQEKVWEGNDGNEFV